MTILKQIIEQVPSIPSLSATTMMVIALTKDPSTSAKELETIINLDPALATDMLRRANSIYYGYTKKVVSIYDAIVLLGFQGVQQLAMAYAVAPILKANLVGYNVKKEELWKHSLLTALSADHLCELKKLSHKDVAFTAGLLHDIGKTIISINVDKRGTILLDNADIAKLPYVQFEEKVIGYSHATVGGNMAKKWNLPDSIVAAITYHHSPLKSQNHLELASIVHIANGIVSAVGISGGLDSFRNPTQQEPFDLLNITSTDIELLMNYLHDSLNDPLLFS